MLISDFRILASLILPADGRIKFKNASATGRFNVISGIPPESRYKKHMKVRICLEYFKTGKGTTGRAYSVIVCADRLLGLINSKYTDEEHKREHPLRITNIYKKTTDFSVVFFGAVDGT